MRIMVTITDAHPHIREALNVVPPRDRAEYMRTMALVGMLFCRQRGAVGSEAERVPETVDAEASRRELMRRGMASLT